MFFEEHLQELRQQRFAPRAIADYVRHVAAHVRGEWLANPGGLRAIWTTALAYFSAAFIASVVVSLAWDRELAVRCLVGTALWMLAAFGTVSLCLGLLRDSAGYRLGSLNVPMLLTLLRVSLVPGIVVFLETRHYRFALALYLLAAISDVLDGMIARRWNQITRLGTVIDPLVDIVFNLAMLWGLAAAGLLAGWVFWIAVTRYAILLVGAAGLYVFVGPVTIRPTFFGRATGVVMTAFIALLTLLYALHGEVALGLTRLTEIALGVLLAATTVQIVMVGWYNLRVMTTAARAPGRVIDDVTWRRR